MNQNQPQKKLQNPVKRNRKPTQRQQAVAKGYIDNFLSGKPITTGQLLVNAGYGKGVAKTPARVLESEGFKESLAQLGLTEELITSSLVSDIKAKPKARVKELTLGANILGMVKRDEKPNPEQRNTYNFIFNADVQDKVRVINEDIKRMLINPTDVQEIP